VIDVVKDQLHGADYVREEDPRVFVSLTTGRGPLGETWKDDYWNECKVSTARESQEFVAFSLIVKIPSSFILFLHSGEFKRRRERTFP